MADFPELPADVTRSPLYNADLAPVPPSQRTWNRWHLAALWVGMAVCIPTYILASYMIRAGLSWQAALIIIAVANLIITVPMVLNGHAGVKYGIPFPVLGRAAFGTQGIHVPALVRAIVACGWFGVQTWIGGLAIYAIWNAVTGQAATTGLDAAKFICFGVFWVINIYFIWRGTESIKWLENFSAPFLILMGLVLIGWGVLRGGGFANVLAQGAQLSQPAARLLPDAGTGQLQLQLLPLRDAAGRRKATEYRLHYPMNKGEKSLAGPWQPIPENATLPWLSPLTNAPVSATQLPAELKIEYRAPKAQGGYLVSSVAPVKLPDAGTGGVGATVWQYLLWLTAMVGFWATMSLSIADITRYATSQRDQVAGQFMGLPGTMVLYSFVGIFVTCATVLLFPDLLIADDAPWDPVSFLARFDNPWVVVVSQLAMLVATLSTNIAANVIAPANAFANLLPGRISFRTGGVLAGLIGIIICPWWLLNEISGILTFVSGLLGPVLGILLCDYFTIRRKQLNLAELYRPAGEYSYGGRGYNPAALLALALGVGTALVGYWVPALNFLYTLSWFTGFLVAYVAYYLLHRRPVRQPEKNDRPVAVAAE
ncbi:NCS1 family nucleobase:cation symporter-1 [Hymenobacter sp. B81]|uniref:NCS1 family nucleobase:cation symporter-1 n=1 Tax=Hymenobacter sp. B81 TaxID=3344878 RepID=UPI0037DDD2A0